MKKAKRLYLFLALVFIIFSCCLVIIPLYFTVLNSFKPYSEIAANIAAFPHNPTLSNFKEAWRRLDFLRVLGNTLIVTVFSAIGTVILSGMTGYWITRHNNWFTKLCFVLILCGMSVPFQCIMITFAKMIGLLKLGNHYLGVILSNWTFSMPMSVFLVTGAVKALPLEIEESAVIDGCSIYGCLTKIVIPLMGNSIVTVLTLQFLNSWNDLLFSQTLISDTAKKTVQTGLVMFSGAHGQMDWGPMFASMTIAVIPTLGLYLFLSKFMIQGMTAGAVKG